MPGVPGLGLSKQGHGADSRRSRAWAASRLCSQYRFIELVGSSRPRSSSLRNGRQICWDSQIAAIAAVSKVAGFAAMTPSIANRSRSAGSRSEVLCRSSASTVGSTPSWASNRSVGAREASTDRRESTSATIDDRSNPV